MRPHHRSAAALAVVFLAGSPAAAAATTARHVFTPFKGGRIAAGAHVARNARGFCWTGSISDFARSDAWRCFLGNTILDPCFSNGRSGSRFVLCAPSPWASLVELRLTRPLPRRMENPPMRDPTVKRPWAIRLTNGIGCTAVSGATTRIDGLGVDYSCAPHGALAGAPRRTTATWTILYATGFTAKSLRRRAIAAAWW